MRISFSVAAIALFAVPALADVSVVYSCIGKNGNLGEVIDFRVEYSGFSKRVGYTNQSIALLHVDSEELVPPKIYQMFGASMINNCKANQKGETFLVTDLEIEPSPPGVPAGYTAHLKLNCPAKSLDVKAVCFLQN